MYMHDLIVVPSLSPCYCLSSLMIQTAFFRITKSNKYFQSKSLKNKALSAKNLPAVFEIKREIMELKGNNGTKADQGLRVAIITK